jgi:hypothetical protein
MSLFSLFFLIFVGFVTAAPSHHHQRCGRSPPPPPTPTNQTTSTDPPPPNKPTSPLAFAALFPVPNPINSWTTAVTANVSNPLPLSDATFRPTDIMAALPPTYVTAPDGEYSLRAHYPQGSYTLENQLVGGISFYAPGPPDVDLSTALEATFAYSVLFPEGFEFNKGGKLPGLYGGTSASEAKSCSGGRRSDECFSARLMFRENGMGEMYTYLPPSYSANQAVCNIPPYSTCNPTYGASVGRGSFTFKPGVRTTVTERVRLNGVGQQDGELEVFVNGQSVINVKGLVLRPSGSGSIYGMQMQTFFGGHSPEYASPVDQNAFFSDFSVAITKTN